MDLQVITLLTRAESEKNLKYLQQAFHILDPDISSGNEKSAKDVENFNQNLYVECAEKAINFNELSIANRCIQIYFSLPMIANQYLARAYLCQFELLAPRGTHQKDNLEKSIPFLFKAIDFGKQNKSLQFIDNILEIRKSFPKKNYKKYLSAPLKKISKALKELDDADYEWRAFLKRTLIDSYIDNKQITDANELASDLTKFIQGHLPNIFDDFYQYLIKHNLLTDGELKSIAASKWEHKVIYMIEKLKKTERPKKGNPKDDAQFDETISNELNEIYKLLIPKNKYILNDNDQESQFMKSSLDLSDKKDDFNTIFKRQKLLISLAHVCLMFEEVNLCSQILGYLKETELVNEEFALEVEFIECEQSVKELRHKQEKYTKNVIKVRVENINKCHEILKNAQRSNNFDLIQYGCITQWNLCLPLLQSGLRNQTRKSLQFVAECLEQIESMEWSLRCQIHFELAKCDEEIEQLQTAEQHLLKALQLDDEQTYTEQLNHALKRLRLRAELYNPPERIEEQAAMIIEQCIIGGKSDKKIKPALSEILSSLQDGTKARPAEINTHSLLLRAGDLLAPKEYTHVLESEMFKTSLGKITEDAVTRLNKKSINYNNCIKKSVDHLSDRISSFERRFRKVSEKGEKDDKIPSTQQEFEAFLKSDYKERLKLWFDLTRIARKQQIWDICRVSSRFCLLYDNEELITRFLKQTNSFGSLFDKDLMRNLAEAHFVLGEALIQYIRNEGIELFEKPKVPEITDNAFPGRRVKISEVQDGKKSEQQNASKRNFETDKEWLEYCEWLEKLCKEATDHFLRGIQIGVQLNESWLVCQGGAYIWNYLHHIFEKKKNNQVNSILAEVLDALRKVGHNTEPELLVAICVALAQGLMMQWLPPEQVKTLQIPSLSNDSHQLDKKGGKPNPGDKTQAKAFTIPNEASADLKKSLEICDYAMNITNGDNLADLVSLKDRYPLIKTWVLAKQINQSPIKNLGITKSVTPTAVERVQDKFTKCMVAVEILNRNLKMGVGSFEIKDTTAIKDIIVLVDQASGWPDKLVELEIWSNLCVLAGLAGQTENLRYCHSRALESISYFEKKKNDNKTVYLISQFLLSEACIALGEHLSVLLSSPISNTKPDPKNNNNRDQLLSSNTSGTSSSKDVRVALRRDALNAFSDGAGYAAKADNYENVIHSARHYWNLCIPYLQQSLERATLYENIREILQSIQVTYKFRPPEKKDDLAVEEAKPEDKKESEATLPPDTATNKSNKKTSAMDSKASTKTKKEESGPKSSVSKSPPKSTEQPAAQPHDSVAQISNPAQPLKPAEKPFNPLEDAFDDLTLICVLYACLFQILIDKHDYEEALDEMEAALNDLPRTKHRLLIYRLKVITKSKLGLNVQMDLQKFREESEKNLAQMYRKVALSSIRHTDTISSYQRAIECLSSEENIWLRFEYIIELAQWMYSHEYKLRDCSDLCEWAIDLLMFNVKSDKQYRAVSASTNTTGAATGRQSKQLNKKPVSKLLQSHSILSTIEDESEVKAVYNEIDKISQAEMKEQLSHENLNKDNIFETNVNKSISWNDLQDIKQLECLIRAHTILALMVGKGSHEYKGHIIKAYYLLNRLFFQSTENALHSIKELQKQALNEPAQVPEKGKSQTQAKKTASSDPKASSVNAQAKKLKLDGGASSNLPQTIEQWSQFEISEEISNAWTHEIMKKTGINQHSIVEPYLLFYYLEQLGKMLSEEGFSQLLFPLYYLQLILVNCAIKFDASSNLSQNVSLNIYVRLKLINLCVQLNLIQSVSFHIQAIATLVVNSNMKQQLVAGGTASVVLDATTQVISNTTAAITANPSLFLKLLQIDPLEVCFTREQIYINKQRISQIEDEENSLSNMSQASFSSYMRKGASTNSTSQFKSKKKQLMQQQQTGYNVKINDQNSKKQFNMQQQQPMSVDELNLPGEKPTISNSMCDCLYKEIWLSIAELLIENGFFQTARDYIYECLNTATNFEDKISLTKIHYLLARLAVYDCNFIEARNHAAAALRTAIDETFWYKSVLLLVESHKNDTIDKDSIEKSVKILNKSLSLIDREKMRRANKSTKLAYMEAMLNYELAEVTWEGVVNGRLNDSDLIRRQRSNKKISKTNTMHPSIFKRLSAVCNMYQVSADLLISNGYKREAIPILRSHARALWRFANDCSNIDAKKDYLLQTLALFKMAIALVDEIWIDVGSIQPFNEIQSISLPVQRELVDLRIEISQLITDMLEIDLVKIKEINQNNLSKDFVLKTVENFLVDSENLTETEQQWNNTRSLMPDLIIANLISCFTLSQKIKQSKTSILYLFGRTYRILSDLRFQLRKSDLTDSTPSVLSQYITNSKWNNILLELIKSIHSGETDSAGKSKLKITSKSTVNSQPQKGDSQHMSKLSEIAETGSNHIQIIDDQTNEKSENHFTLLEDSHVANLIDQESLKSLLIVVNQYDAQAIECLFQALNLAFSIEDKLLTRNISYELIEITGRFDLPLTSQLISLYQSVCSAIDAENIVEKSSIDPKNSLLTGYLQELKYFKKQNILHNTLNSPITKSILDSTKQKLNAFKYLTINGTHFNLSRDLPANYILFIMQHNHTKTEMYGTVIDKSKQAQPTPVAKASKAPNASVQINQKAVGIKIKTDPFELAHLQQQWKEWKASLQSFNLKLEFQLNNDVSRKPNNGSNSSAAVEDLSSYLKYYIHPTSPKFDEIHETIYELDSKFEYLIEKTQNYLREMNEFFTNYFNPNDSVNNSKQSINPSNMAIKPADKIIILADLDLCELPLEALRIFYDNPSVLSLSRDFSLQFFANRYYSQKESELNAKSDDKKPEKAVSKQTQKQPPMPVANTEPLPESAILVDQSRVKYLVDIFNESTVGLPPELSPISSFKTLMQKYIHLSGRWSGIAGGDHSSSLGECEDLLEDANCLLFNGTERFLSYFSSNKISSVNLNDCKLLLANDLAQTSKSYSRLGKSDVLRNARELECENPTEASVLLSLTGIKSIMQNQWAASLAENCDKFNNMLKEFIENRQSCGEIIRFKTSPYLKHLITENQKKEEEKKQTSGGEKDKKGTNDKKGDKKADNKSKSPSRSKSPAKKTEKEKAAEHSDESKAKPTTADSEAENAKALQDEELLRKLAQIRKENFNMVCYGLPDVYITN